jgi:hypothetical protein
MFFQNGKPIQPESRKMCVLYDPENGIAIHTHEAITFTGGRIVEDKEMEANAFQQATKVGKDTSKLKTLHVSPKDVERGSVYKVDLESLRLVKVERPSRSELPKRSSKVE